MLVLTLSLRNERKFHYELPAKVCLCFIITQVINVDIVLTCEEPVCFCSVSRRPVGQIYKFRCTKVFNDLCSINAILCRISVIITDRFICEHIAYADRCQVDIGCYLFNDIAVLVNLRQGGHTIGKCLVIQFTCFCFPYRENICECLEERCFLEHYLYFCKRHCKCIDCEITGLFIVREHIFGNWFRTSVDIDLNVIRCKFEYAARSKDRKNSIVICLHLIFASLQNGVSTSFIISNDRKLYKKVAELVCVFRSLCVNSHHYLRFQVEADFRAVACEEPCLRHIQYAVFLVEHNFASHVDGVVLCTSCNIS